MKSDVIVPSGLVWGNTVAEELYLGALTHSVVLIYVMSC